MPWSAGKLFSLRSGTSGERVNVMSTVYTVSMSFVQNTSLAV